MNQFDRYQQTSLYISSEAGDGLNFFGFYLPDTGTQPASISYEDAWSKFIGLFINLKKAPPEQGLSALIQSLQKNFPAGSLGHTSLAWVTLSSALEEATFQLLSIKSQQDKGVVLSSHFTVDILGAAILLADVSPVLPALSNEGNFLGLYVTYAPTPETSAPIENKNVFIPFTGVLRGCIQADIAQNENRQQAAGVPDRGFYSFISKPDTPDTYQGCYYPIFAAAQQKEPEVVYTGFHMSFDPLDPFNPKRTRFTYAGFAYRISKIEDPPYNQIEIVSGSSLALKTNYMSVFGSQIKLLPLTNTDQPASFVLCALPDGYDLPYYMAPDGDFQMVAEGNTPNIGGGLSGTEFFKMGSAGGADSSLIIRFQSGQPACIKSFPFDLASPVGAPSDSLASPFSGDYLTSWATIYATSGQAIPYVAQPTGASLYAKGQEAVIKLGILNPTDLAFSFTADKATFFPLFPYAGLTEDLSPRDMAKSDITALEEIVLAPQRRMAITRQSTTHAHLIKGGQAGIEVHYATTPSGLLAKTTQNAEGSAIEWNQFLLGKNGSEEIAFNNPTEQVITAMQSSEVFLVVSNATYLSGFANSVTIDDWKLSVNTGTKQTYGDYRNLMIFKGRKGKLYDPDNVSNCLIANPKKWSQAADFSIPQTADAPEPSQLVILSNWLQTYFKNAYEQTSDYFDKFKTIAISENWTGILFLRVDLTGLPNNLSGIVAGVSNPSAFNAHHLGIEVSPVELSTSGVPQLTKPSSFFGLVYYLDPGFIDTTPIQAIPPGNSSDYDFKLLALKILFENTTVKGFESYAQLTLNTLFGSSVTKVYDPANLYKNVLLTGSLQISQGRPVYSLLSKNDDAFYVDNNIINKIEITGAVLSSKSSPGAAQQVSWFALDGFIDYNILKTPEGRGYDLFSFGNEEGKDLLRKGLNFSNLGISMTFSSSTPGKSNLSFSAGEIRFNPSPNVSSLRSASIYAQLQLGLENLLIAPEGKSPKDNGFLDVISDMPLPGPGSQGWYGIRFKLNMGTPGALAGNIGLNSYLLCSWSPDSKGERYNAGIGIALPGSGGGGKLLSLQTVLSLSIGQIRLTQVGENDPKTFMLMFTEIALKFLGLLKLPPSGNTLFYLFGDPNASRDKSALGWYAMYKNDK